MQVTPELLRQIDSKVRDPQVRVLLFKIIEKSNPKFIFTEYDDLHQKGLGMDDSYDTGFREGHIDMSNNLFDLVQLILR